MIVDAHLHVFLSTADDPERMADPIAPAERTAPVDLLEKEMAAAGVGGAVLIPLGAEDSYVAAACAAHPSRYMGIAVARPGEHDPGLVADRLERGRFRGLRMFELPGEWEDASWRGVLARLEQDGRVLWVYPRVEDLTNLAVVASRLTGLRIVLNHCGLTQAGIGVDEQGRPRLDSVIPQPTEPFILDLARQENVSVVLSGAYAFSHQRYPYLDIGEVARRLLDAFGPDRLMWGSDFPWIIDDPGYRQTLAIVDHHLPGLSTPERSAILGGTCRRVLDWPKE